MRKRILGLGMITAAVMLMSIAGTASAWFEVKKSATVRGYTGNISITTYDIWVTNSLQPGDTQYAWLKVKNSSGRCPLKIISAVAQNYPGWLIVKVDSGDFNECFQPGHFKYFLIWLKMKEFVTGPKGKFFSFQIQFTARNCPTVPLPTAGP